LPVSVPTYQRISDARRLTAVICVLASVAILAHHSVPEMNMHGMSSAMETCVATVSHVTEGVAVPAAFFAVLLAPMVLIAFSPLLVSPHRRVLRARASPTELRIALRC
jgi:hypothetical protein